MPLRGGSRLRFGVDITSIKRMVPHTLAKHADGVSPLASKFLTPREEYMLRSAPIDRSLRKGLTVFMAGRWALKEAVIKCFSPTATTTIHNAPNLRPLPREIEIHQTPLGALFALVYDNPPWLDPAVRTALIHGQRPEDAIRLPLATDTTDDVVVSAATRGFGEEAKEWVEAMERRRAERKRAAGGRLGSVGNPLALQSSLEDVKDEDALVVDVSLSHDDGLATAIAWIAGKDVEGWRDHGAGK